MGLFEVRELMSLGTRWPSQDEFACSPIVTQKLGSAEIGSQQIG